MRRGNVIPAAEWLQRNQNAAKLTIAMLLLVSLACNAFAGNSEPLPLPPDTITPMASPTTQAAMAATVTMAATHVANQPVVTMLVDLNIRNGPGVHYGRVGFVTAGTSVPVQGVDVQSGWWKIECPASIDSSECWVSGGSQYVVVDNSEGVPAAAAPATPTAPPPTVEAGRGWLAYVDGGRLYVAGLNLAGNLPTLVSDGRQVSAVADVQQFAFSPDGRRIAYVAGHESGNELLVVNVDGSDHRAMVASSILPSASNQDPEQSVVLIDDIQWLPQADGIAFNTRTSSLTGPGGGSQEDLWVVTINGQLLELFPAGTGGGAFLLTGDGQVMLSRADAIVRAALDTQASMIVLPFEPINTASEYIYYPQTQARSGGLYVSVPAADPWVAGAETTLWQLPATGSARELGRVADVLLMQPVTWSADGSLTAFLRRPHDATEPLVRLFTADAQGAGAVPYAGSTGMAFFAWNPEDDHFLYAGAGFYAVGRPQAPPQQILLPVGLAAAAAQWTSNDSYIVAIHDAAAGQWELQSASTSGESQSLVRGTGQAASFATWLP